ncbi:hypothetical protein AAFF_G00069740 [Aldrovandia affinis]|uniref:Oligopeptide/dipeptide ABC transporter C-terminal domain-containing protein n=1 Tax=Aldrovandia affinis TaxID=143900 RepID=A0AAD7R1R0_9TELE|nr:hypothetical protein AAFF_G00069740 [Aldrovandia affinis]
MTALNPVYTVGDQLIETITLHQDVSKREAPEISHARHSRTYRSPMPKQSSTTTAILGRYAPACNDCHGTFLQSGFADRRRADDCPGRNTQAQIMDLMPKLAAERDAAVLLITHDLGVVAGFCDSVQVIAGGIVESGTADEIFHNPQHPYTWGLLGSMTRLDEAQRHRLHSIAGAPPSV